MYRLGILLVLFSAIILSGCSKSTEPEKPKPQYFNNTAIAFQNWHDTGFPEGILPGYSVEEKMNFKARAYFYNVTPSDVLLNSILNEIPEGYNGDEGVPVLDVVYDPSLKGAYNFTPDLTDPAKCWGGLQRLVKQDEVQGNINSYQIQMWVQIAEGKLQGAKLYMDLGRISEDVIPNGRYDTEDKNHNGLLDAGEDTGLDGLPDNQEPSYNEQTNSDPAGDDFAYSDGGYSSFNGTENNALSIAKMKLPDTEDLDLNGNLDRRNGFYRYEIPLDSPDADKRFIVERGNNRWVKIRIPISAFKNTIGQPVESLPVIIRLWFSGAQSKIRLRFAELGLTPHNLF